MAMHTTKIYPDPKNHDFFYRVKLVRAKKSVILSRQDVDVLSAIKGDTIACMNANCAMRSAAEGAFPHPCYLAVFNSTSAFIVHKKNAGGQPTHAVWYKHNGANHIDIHDRMGPEEVLRRGFGKRLVMLRPPKDRTGENINRVSRAKKTDQTQSSHKIVVSVGAARRALKAGILSLPDMMLKKKVSKAAESRV